MYVGSIGSVEAVYTKSHLQLLTWAIHLHVTNQKLATLLENGEMHF